MIYQNKLVYLLFERFVLIYKREAVKDMRAYWVTHEAGFLSNGAFRAFSLWEIFQKTAHRPKARADTAAHAF